MATMAGKARHLQPPGKRQAYQAGAHSPCCESSHFWGVDNKNIINMYIYIYISILVYLDLDSRPISTSDVCNSGQCK